MTKTAMKKIFRFLFLLFTLFSCKTKTNNAGFKIHINIAREFEIANMDLYEEIRTDILCFKKEYPSKFEKEHCFRLFAQPKDSLIIMMVDTSNFGNACTSKFIDFFYLDTLFISLMTDFQKGTFKFKQNGLIPQIIGLDLKPEKTYIEGIYDPKTWIYKFNHKNQVTLLLPRRT